MPPLMPSDFPTLQPWDEHNQRLARHTHPPDWINPVPTGRYNLVVVGGGTAGLVAAAGAAGLGARVALIEKHLMGGDCLNTGCVPSKALIRAARAVTAVRDAGRFGVRVDGQVQVDFAAVMERMRRIRADLSSHDSVARFRDLGVDVFLGTGRFAGPETVEVEGREIRFARAVIATGARAYVPPIPGLAEIPYLTHEKLFSLTSLPRKLGILGAGPIGCEMAQCFARFGCTVYLVESTHGILPREDQDAARMVLNALERDGVRLRCCARELRVSPADDGIRLQLKSHDHDHDLVVDRVLVATGRSPNLEGLGLDAAGVAFEAKGVRVNDRLRTTNPRIYACGDVCSPFQFTHAADAMARVVIRNALFHGRARASALLVPRCTYTSPEIAQVGFQNHQAEEVGTPVDTFEVPLGHVDRAVVDGETGGFVKVHVRRGTDRIIGGTIVANHAGDLISEITVAMRGGLGLRRIGDAIHPYPTQAEAVRRTGDLYQRSRLSPFVRRLFGKWLDWQRR